MALGTQPLGTGAFPSRVEIHGLREVQRDFNKISRELGREVGKELREIAEPVAGLVRQYAEHEQWGPKTVRGIAAGRRGVTAVVRQRNKKVTGKRPDFGALQMRKAFIPAAERMQPVVVKALERMLDRLTSEHGFGRGGLL